MATRRSGTQSSDDLAPWLILAGSGAILLAWWWGRGLAEAAIEAGVESEGVVGAAASWISEAVMDKIVARNIQGKAQGSRPITSDVYETAIWTAVRGPIVNGAGDRSGSTYDAVIDQFRVESNPRYVNRDGSTFCNIFVEDVMFAMGYVLPWDTASNIAVWFQAGGGMKDGWRSVMAWDAQEAANRGQPTVAVWANVGGIGHMAVVRPGQVDGRLGPTIAQAGAVIFPRGYVGNGFGASRVAIVSYFTAA